MSSDYGADRCRTGADSGEALARRLKTDAGVANGWCADVEGQLKSLIRLWRRWVDESMVERRSTRCKRAQARMRVGSCEQRVGGFLSSCWLAGGRRWHDGLAQVSHAHRVGLRDEGSRKSGLGGSRHRYRHASEAGRGGRGRVVTLAPWSLTGGERRGREG